MTTNNTYTPLRQAIEYDELLDPEYIRKINDVEKSKLAKMINSLERNGYKGRPVVVLDNANEGYIALTGSHRLAAAEAVGIEIPAVIVHANEYTVELLDVRDDNELADVAESLYNDKKISNSAYQLLTMEVKQNDN